MKITSRILTGLIAIASFMACQNNSMFPDFEETESGLYYQIFPGEGNDQAILNGDIITLDLTYKTQSDSVLFTSDRTGQPTMLKVVETKYPGDIMEGFSLMKVGDSAVFITSADSFFNKIANQPLPEFIDSGSYLKFYVKVQKAQTEEALLAEKQADEELKSIQEMETLEKYLEEKNIEVEPTESGLYYLETEAGKGDAVERGKVVKVHYKGTLLDGRVFDSSYERGEPLEFAIGTGQVIRGWDEGIGYMKEGGKATLIIPSELAYGNQAPPGSIITPFSTLLFEVELVEVK